MGERNVAAWASAGAREAAELTPWGVAELTAREAAELTAWGSPS